METGNLDVMTDAMARTVTLGKDGRANGVDFIDKSNGREEHVAGRIVILAASALESTRILFNSKIGNASGHLGRWLTDSTGGGLKGPVPALENMPIHNEDGTSVFHL